MKTKRGSRNNRVCLFICLASVMNHHLKTPSGRMDGYMNRWKNERHKRDRNACTEAGPNMCTAEVPIVPSTRDKCSAPKSMYRQNPPRLSTRKKELRRNQAIARASALNTTHSRSQHTTKNRTTPIFDSTQNNPNRTHLQRLLHGNL